MPLQISHKITNTVSHKCIISCSRKMTVISYKVQLQRKFFISVNELWLYKITVYVMNCLPTRCSAIAERPRCRVHYSFRQK